MYSCCLLLHCIWSSSYTTSEWLAMAGWPTVRPAVCQDVCLDQLMWSGDLDSMAASSHLHGTVHLGYSASVDNTYQWKKLFHFWSIMFSIYYFYPNVLWFVAVWQQILTLGQHLPSFNGCIGWKLFYLLQTTTCYSCYVLTNLILSSAILFLFTR